MTFKNYKIGNNATSTIASSLSAWGTALLCKTGDGGKFPSTFPFFLTLEKVSAWVIIKREIIEVSNKVGDSFTIARSAGYCLANSTATTQTNTAFSFDVDDIISLRFVGENIADINAELSRIVTTDIAGLNNTKLDISDYQNGTKVYWTTSVWTDSYAVTLSPAPSALIVGMCFKFMADVGNTGVASLNVNWLGAKTIKKLHDLDLATGDIEAGQIVTVTYDGTYFQMDSQVATIIDLTTVEPKAIFDSSFNAGENIPDWFAGCIIGGTIMKCDETNPAKLDVYGITQWATISWQPCKIVNGGIASSGLAELIPWSPVYLKRRFTAIANSSTITQATNNANEQFWANTSQSKIADSFTVATDFLLRSISLPVKKQASPVDNIYINLYSWDQTELASSSNLPTTNLVLIWTSNTVNGASLTTSYVSTAFTFPDIILSPGVIYFFEVNRTWSVDPTNYYFFWKQTWWGASWKRGYYWAWGPNWIVNSDVYTFTIQMWTGTESNIGNSEWVNISRVWKSITAWKVQIEKKGISSQKTILNSTSNSAATGSLTAPCDWLIIVQMNSTGSSSSMTTTVVWAITTVGSTNDSYIKNQVITVPVRKWQTYSVTSVWTNSTNTTTVYFVAT